MEQNKEMTAQQSLALIARTMDSNRKDIIRKGGKYFILWGCLLTIFSLLIYFLWKTTDSGAWNNLWFVMPIVGYGLSWLLQRNEETEPVQNDVSRTIGNIWSAFGIFACSVAVVVLLYSKFGSSAIGAIVAGASLSAQIVLLFGLAETISGVVLKNLTIKMAGFITGIGGLATYYFVGANEEQMLLFTFAGIVLAATGLIVKRQYK